MSYLTNLGITTPEDRLNRLCYGRVRLFNEDLDFGNYGNFVKAYSLKRRKYPLEKIFGDRIEKTMSGSSKMENILTEMYRPVQEPEIIKRRQDLVRHFSNASSEEEELMQSLLFWHSELIDSVVYEKQTHTDHANLQERIHPFMETVYALSQLKKMYATNPLMEDFALRIEGLFEEHPVLNDAYLFDWKTGRILFRQDSQVSLTRVSLEGKASIDLGLFKDHKELVDYSLMSNYHSDISNFVISSASLVYTLGSFFYLANAFNNANKKGMPVCMPKINDEGIFELKEGLPIATRIKGRHPIVNIDFESKPNNNHVLLSGPHSGGKTELLKNIGVYHALALSGFFVPARYANVPLTKRIVTSFKKEGQTNKGSLESEIIETANVIRGLEIGDLVLWDEFLDTTKPELAAYLEEPLLKGFASTPASVILVSHRATSLKDDLGFRFMYPELKQVEVPESQVAWHVASNGRNIDPTNFTKGEKLVPILIPTHRFLEGKPNSEITRLHAHQMWKKVKEEIAEYRTRIRAGF